MKKYNVKNYVRYKDDLKRSMPKDKPYNEYSRNEMIIKFMPLVENIARKFATSQQASGILSINDILQEGNMSLVKAVDKLDWEVLDLSDNIEQTLKSFYSKVILDYQSIRSMRYVTTLKTRRWLPCFLTVCSYR